jgi:hypothetical protein
MPPNPYWAFELFFQGYIEALLWSSESEDEPPMSFVDMHVNALAESAHECLEFMRQGRDLYKAHWSDDYAGHDFALTRNHHGTGFWDRGFSNGDKLTALAARFGEVTPLWGDDGKIHLC